MAEKTHAVLVYDEIELASKDFVANAPVRVGTRCMHVHICLRRQEQQRPIFQLCCNDDPKLSAPLGLTTYLDEIGATRTRLAFQLRHPALISSIAFLDEFIKKLAFTKCKEWFGKELSEQEVSSLYEPLLKNGEEPALQAMVDLQALKVWKAKEGTYTLGCLEDMKRMAGCWPNIALSHVWFLPQRFGCALQCVDILIFDQAPEFPFRTS